jgi:CheY-like chemotaxis protein
MIIEVVQRTFFRRDRNRQVLIGLLEDDLAIQEMLRLLFQSEGHKVSIYSTATDCLAYLQIDDFSPELASPDLLLVDLHLSQATSGAEVIERVRANPRLEHLPVILMTASAFMEKEELERLHATLLIKPFDIDTLMQLVNELTGGAHL